MPVTGSYGMLVAFARRRYDDDYREVRAIVGRAVLARRHDAIPAITCIVKRFCAAMIAQDKIA